MVYFDFLQITANFNIWFGFK